MNAASPNRTAGAIAIGAGTPVLNRAFTLLAQSGAELGESLRLPQRIPAPEE